MSETASSSTDYAEVENRRRVQHLARLRTGVVAFDSDVQVRHGKHVFGENQDS